MHRSISDLFALLLYKQCDLTKLIFHTHHIFTCFYMISPSINQPFVCFEQLQPIYLQCCLILLSMSFVPGHISESDFYPQLHLLHAQLSNTDKVKSFNVLRWVLTFRKICTTVITWRVNNYARKYHWKFINHFVNMDQVLLAYTFKYSY